MTFRNKLTASLTTATLAAALSACSNPSPEAGRPDTTAPPTATSSVPPTATSTPSEVSTTPPSRPETAAGGTLAAGESFLTYYVELLNYGYTTGDPQPFLSASDKGCEGCQGLANYMRKTNAKNGGLRGDYKNALVGVNDIFRSDDGRLGGTAAIKVGTYEERLSPGATFNPQTGRDGTMDFTLSSSAGNWVMYEMQLKE